MCAKKCVCEGWGWRIMGLFIPDSLLAVPPKVPLAAKDGLLWWVKKMLLWPPVVLGHGKSRTETPRLIPNRTLKINSLEGLQRAAGVSMKAELSMTVTNRMPGDLGSSWQNIYSSLVLKFGGVVGGSGGKTESSWLHPTDPRDIPDPSCYHWPSPCWNTFQTNKLSTDVPCVGIF